MSELLQDIGGPGSQIAVPPVQKQTLPKPVPVKPVALTPPNGPPVPVLQQQGFHGGLGDFAGRAQAVDDAHRAAYGTGVSPQVAFAVAVSPVPTEHFPSLFSVPLNATAARARGDVHVARQQRPQDFFVTRPDGVSQPDSPLKNLTGPITGTTAPSGMLGVAKAPPTQSQFLKKYPMTTLGMLPIPSWPKLEGLLASLNKPLQPVTPPSGHQAPGSQAQQLEDYQRFQQEQASREHVTTIKQAQTELNNAMGTDLPVTGVFNQTWSSALTNWTKTTGYLQKQLTFQAQQEGFGSNVDAYAKAWHAKQDAAKKGLTGWFAASMPLGLFGHGSFWDDLASVPGYLKGPSNNPLNIGLHSLTRTAGLTLDTVGGTVTQAKADLAAGSTFVKDIAVATNGSPLALNSVKPQTYEEALQHAREQLHANPTWLRAALGDTLPTNEPKWLRILDQTTNLAGDLVLLRKPALTGERVAAGDIAAASESPYLRATSRWAYNDLARYGRDGIGRAASRLEGGQGARALVARTAKLVQRGDMTPERFQTHVAELYATGWTVVNVAGKDAEVQGPLLTSLRTDKLPTPGVTGRTWLSSKSALRDWLDSYDTAARANGATLAPNLVASLRSAVAHYVPSRVGAFDEILPERVFNFVLKNKLGDDPAALANRLESQLVRFQGTENVRGIQAVQQKLQKLYHDKFPVSDTPPKDAPFEALLSTEAPSVFQFSKGADQEVNTALGGIERTATSLNRTLNRLAQLHSRVILSGLNPFTGLGGFSLFWKHAVGDTLRTEVGGGGVLTGIDRGVIDAKREINRLAANNPEASRLLGAYRERAVKGEANWLLNRGGNTLTRSFRTGDQFGKSNYMTAAGGYVRRMLDDPALAAYRSGGDALTQLVLHDRTYRGMWKSAKATNAELTAEDYAAAVGERFRNLEGALSAQGQTLDDAKAFYDTVRGATSDKQLGKYLKDNHVDFDVHSGQVVEQGTFDAVTGKWIGDVIMKPNKLNRGRFAENVLAKTYSELRAAGWNPHEALQTAASVGGALTKYHMLDFANRLQVEQDLRWLSYFATKHRLYFKWVLGTFLRNPRYAAAVADFKQTLDQHGGWTLPVKLFGLQWDVPLERLVWVPGREYDETSPLALGVLNFVKSGGNLDAAVKGAAGTGGNILTRSDTATALGTKLLAVGGGKAAPTYTYAIAGLDKTTAARITRALNEYQISFQLDHGHYDTESNAVHKVLLAQMGEEYWRANLPLPVVPLQDRSAEQKLMAQFMSLSDPRARSKFLSDHKGFSDNFGVYNDPATNLHNREFFARWAKTLDAYRSARTSLYEQARKTGQWTTGLEKQRRLLNEALNRTRNQLLIDDAQQSGVNTGGLVPNGTTVPYGIWGKVVNADPLFDVTHALNVLFPKLGKVGGDVIGPMQKQMQAELGQLNDPNYVAKSGYTPEQVKTRKVELLQSLQTFASYPTDALAAVRDTYQTKYVNGYWTEYNKRYLAIQKLPSGERHAADAAFRAWRDSQDHTVDVNGIKFPSPARMAWATLDPVTRTQRLSYLSGKPLADVADYELDLLGVKHPPNVSLALATIQKAEAAYRAQYGTSVSRATLLDVAKQVDRQAGFHGFASYYTAVLTAPRVKQFELTTVYSGMPASVRSKFDTTIGKPALEVAAGIKANGGTSYYEGEWRKAVKTQLVPWLNAPENKDLRTFLEPMGPNFLYTLVGR